MRCGLFIIVLASGLLTSSHVLVFTTLGLTLLVRLLELLDEGSLELGFFLAVSIAVIIEVVGLGLVGRVLGGGRLLRIPRTILANMDFHWRMGASSYHLIAKRVTRGFSASTFEEPRPRRKYPLICEGTQSRGKKR